MVLGQYGALPVGTWLYWVSMRWYCLLLGGNGSVEGSTGSIEGSTGWYLVVLGQYNLVLLGIKSLVVLGQ